MIQLANEELKVVTPGPARWPGLFYIGAISYCQNILMILYLHRHNSIGIMKAIIPIAFFAMLLWAGCESPATSQAAATENKETMDPSYNPEAKLQELGITLPEVGAPVANYVNTVRVGNLVYTSGKGPNTPDGGYITGKVGADLTQEQGYDAARLAAIQLIAALKAEVGDLKKIKRIVKVLGMVNCTPDFGNQPEVVNGCSDLLVQVFGDHGRHARSAVGMGSLPRNIAIEIELIAEVYP